MKQVMFMFPRFVQFAWGARMIVAKIASCGTPMVRLRCPREPGLRKARVCYDHLAGELGVLVFDGLEQRRLLGTGSDGLQLTRNGQRFFAGIGIDVEALVSRRRPLCLARLDL